ncbi:MAG: hypothetical protein E7K04_04775 [Helicobacter sp.]|nr:hypothetical protein [Helicobacter sp.]
MRALKYVLTVIITVLLFGGGMILYWFLSKTDLIDNRGISVNFEIFSDYDVNTTQSKVTKDLLDLIKQNKKVYEDELDKSCDITDVSFSFAQDKDGKIIPFVGSNDRAQARANATLHCA